MTRINVIPVSELSDQHLVREYNELPRVIKGKYNLCDAPDIYCLGVGHIKFCKKHQPTILQRYQELCNEMKYRGFTVNFPFEKLQELYKSTNQSGLCYEITENDIELNRARITQKIKTRPTWYRWTGRPVPDWIKNSK